MPLLDLSKRSDDWIRNVIWNEVANGIPTPGQVTIEELREELERRGLEPIGFHNT